MQIFALTPKFSPVLITQTTVPDNWMLGHLLIILPIELLKGFGDMHRQVGSSKSYAEILSLA